VSKKVRIHDLAKKHDMSGKDMAGKLRDLGFTKAKSHMSALDEFDVIQAEALLQAHGVIGEAKRETPSDPDGTGGLVLRKKKKKKATAAEAPKPAPAPVDEPVAAPTPGTTAENEPGLTELEPTAPVAEELPGTSTGSESAGTEAAPVEEAQPTPAPVVVPEDTEPVEAEPGAQDPTPAVDPDVVTTEDPGHEVEVPAEPVEDSPTVGELDPEPPVAVEPEPTGEPEATTQATDGDPDGEDAKPRGTVVGFIDPAKFQRTEPTRRKAESRRLQSRDDAAPDVQPTFARGPGGIGRGGGGPRGSLTPAQLRERESSRFLRRSRPGGQGGQTGGRRSTGRSSGPRDTVTDSPFAGSEVAIEAPVTLNKLAEALKLKANVVLKTALEQGLGMLNINASLDEDTATLLADGFEVQLKVVHEVAAEEALIQDLREQRNQVHDEALEVRPPSVAFLGHVDHGKTTLIDSIRKTQVADGEAGGITQHIGAYQVKTRSGHFITIVDTPGHAAFTGMRARGAKAVDLVVLVVAGDDGVKPHTEEALAHARAAEVPVVVAITKSDKPAYDANKTMQQLTALGLNPEDWGGETAMINVSAMNGDGVENLLERLFLEGELLELHAHSDGPAAGVVLEAEKQPGKGIVAHLMIQDGTLRPGDVILAGEGYGKVRSIHDDRGKIIDAAGPSKPVEVSGLDALPGVGDPFYVVDKLSQAKEVATERERKNRAVQLAESKSPSSDLESILGKAPKQERETINLIIRADVQGSVEVLRHAIAELQHDEVEVKLIHVGVGTITESDVDLAATSDGILVAFHVGVGGKARTAADRAHVDILRFDVIYELLDHLRNLMEGALSPEYVEEITGHVEIRRLFKSSKIGLIAGCYVLDGEVRRDSRVRLMRDDAVVHTGRLGSLRRESDDAKSVREGFECGIVLKDYRDIKEGDIIEAFSMREIKRTLEQTTRS